MPVLAWVLKRPWVLLVAALVATTGYFYVRLQAVEGQRDRARADLAAVSAKVEQQNQAVAAWKDAAGIQAARALEAEKKAARARATAAARAQRILVEPVPAACPEAIAWGASKGAQIGKLWEEGQ